MEVLSMEGQTSAIAVAFFPSLEVERSWLRG